MKKKRIIILGSTGSIGTQTLDVIRQFPNRFEVVGLSTHTNIVLLEKQREEFQPKYIAITDTETSKQYSKTSNDCTVFTGPESLEELVDIDDIDIIVTAIVGAVGIPPTLLGIKKAKRIAIANKETLVAAGEIVMREAKKYGTEILPIDSEHAAIHQCIRSGKDREVQKIILTASGGALRDWPLEKLKNATVTDALNHPNWSMGKKITIDSATLANKGLEVIEAMHLFSLSLEQIEVVIHPQSIIHSAVEFCDGSIIAQIGTPDMKIPIAYALSYPDRLPYNFAPFSFFDKKFEFHKPDRKKFPMLALAETAAQIGGTMPAMFNTANEKAVETFLSGNISFGEINTEVEKEMKKHQTIDDPSITDIYKITCSQYI